MVAYLCTWLLVFAIPWENVVTVPGIGTISKLFGIGAFGVTLLRVLLQKKIRRLAPFHWAAFAYLCWILLSVLWSVNETCHEGKLCDVPQTINTYVQLFLMLWVLWEATPTASRITNLLQAYVLGAFVAAASTIHNYSIGASAGHAATRFTATGFDANDLGMMLALALPMAWYLASVSRYSLQRWLNRAYFAFGGVAILLTGSRGAMLATIVALSVVPWTLTHLRRGVRIAAIVFIAGAGVAALTFVPATTFERLGTTGTEISEGNLNSRVQIWKTGLTVVPERPLHGFGPAGWRTAVTARLGVKGAHNTFLAILVDAGLIGLLLYLSMFVLVLRGILVLSTFQRRIGLILLATLIVALTPLDWDTRKPAWVMLGLLVAYSEALAHAQWGRGPRAAMRPEGNRPGSPQPARMPRRVIAR
ncbi:MAG TPA: O-antigen ligase family protein [Gemmatimonadales bacterium]|nr:O-antigen ligase family protein [Gemmatimonadales bacterium]